MKNDDYTRLGGFLFVLQFFSVIYLIFSCLAFAFSIFGSNTDWISTTELIINIVFCVPSIYMLGTGDSRFRSFCWIVTAGGAFYRLALVLVVSYNMSTFDFSYLIGNLIGYCIVRGLVLVYLYRSKRAAVYFHFSAPLRGYSEFKNDHAPLSPENFPNVTISESTPEPTTISSKTSLIPTRCSFLSSLSSERRAFIKGILCTVLILLIAIGAFFGVKAYKIYLRSVYDDGFIDGLKTGYNQGAKDAYPEYSYTYRSAYTAGFVDSQNGNLFNSDPPIQNNP